MELLKTQQAYCVTSHPEQEETQILFLDGATVCYLNLNTLHESVYQVPNESFALCVYGPLFVGMKLHSLARLLLLYSVDCAC